MMRVFTQVIFVSALLFTALTGRGQGFHISHYNDLGVRESIKDVHIYKQQILGVGGRAVDADVFENNDKPYLNRFNVDTGDILRDYIYFEEDSTISYSVRASMIMDSTLYFCGAVTSDTVSSFIYRGFYLASVNLQNNYSAIIKIDTASRLETAADLTSDSKENIYTIEANTDDDLGFGYREFTVRKFAPDLIPIWDKTINDPIYDYHPKSICIDSSDFIYALYSPFDTNTAVVKFNTDGDTLWTKLIPRESRVVFPKQIESTPDGGLLIFEWAEAADVNLSHFVPQMVKIDSAGNIVWSKHFHYDIGAVGNYSKFRVLPNGDFVIVFFKGEDNLLLMRCDAQGNVIKTFPLTGASFFYPIDVTTTEDRGYVIVGILLNDFEPNNATTFIVRTDSEGNFMITSVIDDLVVDLRDYITLGPNPCHEHLKVDLRPEIDETKLAMFLVDNMGRIVQNISSGHNDLSAVSSGIYQLIVTYDRQYISNHNIVKI